MDRTPGEPVEPSNCIELLLCEQRGWDPRAQGVPSDIDL